MRQARDMDMEFTYTRVTNESMKAYGKMIKEMAKAMRDTRTAALTREGTKTIK